MTQIYTLKLRPQKSSDQKIMISNFCLYRPDASFEALKQKLESVMPASGSEVAEASDGVTSSTTSIQRSVGTVTPASVSTAATGSIPANQVEN